MGENLGYDFVREFFDENQVSMISVNGLYGFVNSKAELVVPCIYPTGEEAGQALSAMLGATENKGHGQGRR